MAETLPVSFMTKNRSLLSGIALAVLTLVCSAQLAAPAHAQSNVRATPGEDLHKKPAKQGWFWYIDPEEEKKENPQPVLVQPPKKEEVKPSAPIVVIPRSQPPKEEEQPKKAISELTEAERVVVCGSKDTWEAACGFVDPGNDFEFQAKQRDELLQMMSLTPENPEAVEAAQRYMKWVVGKASMAANMWYFNMVQNPDLDPTVKNPISEVGLALASRVVQASQYEYFKLIKEEGGVLFFFTRNDCVYCHDQSPYARRVAHTMGLRMVNIPLDGVCLPDFKDENCGDNVKPEQAAALDVKIVPAIYLYVPSNTWIRLGTGVVTDSTILANTVNFFSAYRAAMLQGLDNGKGSRPSVTFDPQLRGTLSGTASADGSQASSDIDRSRMMELLGY